MHCRNEIAQDVREWERYGRDASYLYSGARLALTQEQVRAHQIMLSELANDFISEAMNASEVERRTKELLRKRIILGLVVGILIALVLAAFALSQMIQSQMQATIAQSQALVAQSQLQRLTKSQLGLLLAP